jgi:hypothetical protein
VGQTLETSVEPKTFHIRNEFFVDGILKLRFALHMIIPALSRRFVLFAALATLALGLSGCDRGTRPPEPIKGASLNASFPVSGEGFTVVFTQEKAGFVEATLKQNGTDVASLAIADLIDNAGAKAKFASSIERIAGHPYAPNGSKGSTLLVANRYQVQVRSLADTFDEAARRSWLTKFQLDTLAAPGTR